MSASVPKVSTLARANLREWAPKFPFRIHAATSETTLTTCPILRMVPPRNHSHSWSKLSGEEELPMWTGRETRDEAGRSR